MLFSWSYRADLAGMGETVVQARVEQDLALWSVRGPVTELMLPNLFVDAFAWHEEARANALVLDYSQAVVAVPLKRFSMLAQVIVRRPKCIAAPAAIISTPEQLGFFQRYAALMEHRGVHREVVLSQLTARGWAIAAARAQAAVCAIARGDLCSRAAPAAEDLRAREPGIARLFDRTDRQLNQP
jgi:hypothetical protein